MKPTLVIINPNAGRRLGMRDWYEIAYLLDYAGIAYSHLFTRARMDAMNFSMKAVAEGIRRIIVVGGDGTMNEVVNGLFSQSKIPATEITLAMIPVGTGNDWGKMYNFPDDYASAVKMITAGKTVLQDVGFVKYQDGELRGERYFVNVAGIGCDAVVTSDTNQRKEKGRGGKIAYLISLLQSLLKYSFRKVLIEADDKPLFCGDLYSANIGICKYNGGGMMQVPFAIADDGLFDITVFRRMGKHIVLRNAGRLYSGSFVKIKYVSTHRAASVKATTEEQVLLEVDGESIGSLPAEFRIMQRALRVVVPFGHK